MLLGLLEHVAHARGADADEHFDEVGTEMVKNGTLASPAMARASKRLAGARRADHQHALGNLAAQLLELARILEEIDDLANLGLGLIDARDIGEGDVDLVFAQQAAPCSCRRTWRPARRPRTVCA